MLFFDSTVFNYLSKISDQNSRLYCLGFQLKRCWLFALARDTGREGGVKSGSFVKRKSGQSSAIIQEAFVVVFYFNIRIIYGLRFKTDGRLYAGKWQISS